MAHQHLQPLLYVLVACQVPALSVQTAVDSGWPSDHPLATERTELPHDRPLRLLFLGNSFTHQGDVPGLTGELAVSAGWPEPVVATQAPGGRSLRHHRARRATLDAVDRGDWDVVVLQDYSTRPTGVGDPMGFLDDVTWFHDRIKAASPDATVVLYETWARHPRHEVYPDRYPDPAAMQAELRASYTEAATAWVPARAAFQPARVVVAPVGDAWEAHLAEPAPLVLHGGDLYHAGRAGQALSAMVLFATIFGEPAAGTSALGLSEARALRLQATADRVVSRRWDRAGPSPR